jgi:hypothetical protein
MAWVTTAQPSAPLEVEPPGEQDGEDGNKVTIFKTAFGKRFARVVEPTGFIYWLQEVPDTRWFPQVIHRLWRIPLDTHTHNMLGWRRG